MKKGDTMSIVKMDMKKSEYTMIFVQVPNTMRQDKEANHFPYLRCLHFCPIAFLHLSHMASLS